MTTIHKEVSEYYGKTLQSSNDLKTGSCKLDSTFFSTSVKKYRSMLHEEVLSSFYGCGSPIPEALSNCTVVDLGCGSGVDVFTAAALVGDEGKVIGIDMTDEQLDKARKQIDYHTQKFGLKKNNVEFHKGIIEDLSRIPENSVDVVISNCVINLSPNKLKCFQEIFRILKPGGELCFSDVYANRRIPTELQNDKVLWGECLSGALYVEDFRRLMQTAGFLDVRTLKSTPVALCNPDIEKLVGKIKFMSITVRAFKIPLEDRCEDYGQVAIYSNPILDNPKEFKLDQGHIFSLGEKVPVCGNTADMLTKTRFSKYFTVTERGPHYGVFTSCGTKEKTDISDTTVQKSCCTVVL